MTPTHPEQHEQRRRKPKFIDGISLLTTTRSEKTARQTSKVSAPVSGTGSEGGESSGSRQPRNGAGAGRHVWRRYRPGSGVRRRVGCVSHSPATTPGLTTSFCDDYSRASRPPHSLPTTHARAGHPPTPTPTRPEMSLYVPVPT